ncbi:MAG: HAD-IB family hydrolase [Clostridia bacterium]|nr:HAD-IB family hydrolase [Clostridia bacterium]
MAEEKALALFDFDGTMIRGDSIVAYVGFARKKSLLSFFGYMKTWGAALLYAAGKISAEESKTRALSFRQKLSPQERDRLDRAFAQEELLPRIYPQAKACLKKHRQEGKITLLVTASTENYMQYVSEALGFDGLLASPIDDQGRVRDNCKGEEKGKRIQGWLTSKNIQPDFKASCAYGDSKSDLPMLRLAGHPVQVNPKKKLRKAAPDMKAVSWC